VTISPSSSAAASFTRLASAQAAQQQVNTKSAKGADNDGDSAAQEAAEKRGGVDVKG